MQRENGVKRQCDGSSSERVKRQCDGSSSERVKRQCDDSSSERVKRQCDDSSSERVKRQQDLKEFINRKDHLQCCEKEDFMRRLDTIKQILCNQMCEVLLLQHRQENDMPWEKSEEENINSNFNALLEIEKSLKDKMDRLYPSQ